MKAWLIDISLHDRLDRYDQEAPQGQRKEILFVSVDNFPAKRPEK